MKEVKINNLKDSFTILYGPQGHIGVIDNILDFYDVRVQIRENQLTGYYFGFDGEVIRIDKNGECESYPEGFFDKFSELAIKLL